MSATLDALRPVTPGRLIVVIGAGGDRDQGKRPLMGEIAARLADVLVVTDDNPRSEDPAEIRAEIVAGAGTGGADVVEIGDRRTAIERALRDARPGDTVLIAGKGHETGQEIAGEVLPFDDREVARDVLARWQGPTDDRDDARRDGRRGRRRLADAGDGTQIDVVGDVFHDSRDVVPGGLFVAIVGERVDGHDYAAACVEAGAAGALVERPVGVPAVVVADTVVALTALAAAVVRRLPELASSASPVRRARRAPRTSWPSCSNGPARRSRRSARSTTRSVRR